MNKIIKFLMVAVPVTLISLGFYFKEEEAGEDMLIKVITENLDRMHYRPLEINDDFSKKVWAAYIKNLDPNKRFLLQSDIDKLKKHELLIDDQTKSGQYDFFDESLEIVNNRVAEAKDLYHQLLEEPFDFTVDEEVSFDEDEPYAKTPAERKDRWRKYLKYNVMTRLSTALDVQESKSLPSADVLNVEEEGMDALEDELEPNVMPETEAADVSESGIEKSFETMEADARKGILKTHEDWFERLTKLDRKDRLATYVNTITTLYDPHTGYFPPADKDNFDIRMSGRLEGIGAQLQEKDGFIKVVSIVPGSPSAMQGELQANDLILKVAQGKDEPVDVVNARIDDAVKIIRGKKGTEVRLTVQKPDGTVKVIPIIRDVIVLEETYAKSTIIQDKSGVKTGYLYLPSFYTDFNDRNGRTCWKDVREELKKLKKDGAEVLIFDLRNNGGGSLPDVVDMAGLFIPKGPIVQVKSRDSKPHIMMDYDSGVEWDKPVVLMVNEFSASASEILAAALQDYKRAVVVGSHITHGKGTVQRFIELNQTFRSNDFEDMGALKLTTQKFYRINGGATQLEGVTPDIIWPDNYKYLKTGEREQENALPWDKIQPAEYTTLDYMKKLETIRKQSEKRTKSNEVFNAIEINAKRWEEQSKMDKYSLNLEKYRKEQKEKKAVNDAYSRLFKPFEDLKITDLTEDAELMKTDTLKAKRAADWHKSIKKDIYLYESLQIAEDLKK